MQTDDRGTARFIVRRFVAVLAFGVCLSPGLARASEAEDAAYAFGYAIQAMGWCRAFLVNGQTEHALEQKYGQPMRGAGAALKGRYGKGLERFSADEIKNGSVAACAKAWSRVGPSGSEYPGLLMKSPFKS